MTKVSVLISNYKNDDITVVHVRECMNSTLMPDEIVVVNDGGFLGLKSKLEALELKTKVIYAYILEDIRWNYTGARNLGIWLSSGDIISVEDNDHIPHKDFYKQCVEVFEKNPNIGRIKTHKRWVVELEDVLKNPIEEWKIIGKRPPHQDTVMLRRSVLLKIKGYDERFAGEYGWCSTDARRRLLKAGTESTNIGNQYVVMSPKTRGLSSRNWKMARTQRDYQSPHGILNFHYIYETLQN